MPFDTEFAVQTSNVSTDRTCVALAPSKVNSSALFLTFRHLHEGTSCFRARTRPLNVYNFARKPRNFAINAYVFILTANGKKIDEYSCFVCLRTQNKQKNVRLPVCPSVRLPICLYVGLSVCLVLFSILIQNRTYMERYFQRAKERERGRGRKRKGDKSVNASNRGRNSRSHSD